MLLIQLSEKYNKSQNFKETKKYLTDIFRAAKDFETQFNTAALSDSSWLSEGKYG